MLSDARSLEAGARLRFDVCIVGAGAAGISLARALRGRGLAVALLESGGLERAPATQDLYRGASVGLPYFPLETCRLRFFGGSTNHWIGYARPLDPQDLELRPWLPDSGWPLRAAELEPWYRRAHPLLELGPFRYDARFWARATETTLPAVGADVLAPTVFQMSPPTRFGERYRDDLVSAPDVTVLLHANAVGFEPGDSGRAVGAVRVATLAGRRFSVTARAHVLAAGGIENARLLLASRSAAHPAGLGNGADRVGRYFSDHPHLARGLLLPSPAFFHTYRTVHGGCIGALRFRPERLRSEGLNNLIVTLVEAGGVDERLAEAMSSPAAVAYEHLARHLERGSWPEDLLEDVGRVLADPDDVAVAHTPLRRRHTGSGPAYRVFFRAEQAPNPESRVTLGDEVDALGLRRARLDWRLSEADYRSLERGHVLFAETMARAGLGRVYFPGPETGRSWLEEVIGGYHHMGTTRMHADPARGVVDPSCRVHGVENLYVAGSSVFPTVGCANPTLTLVALALRLGETLARRLRGS